MLTMRRLPSIALATLFSLGSSLAAFALDFRSVSEAATLFDAPSAKSKPMFVIMGGTPVELVLAVEGWAKVREPKGGLFWIDKKLLSERRTAIVRADRATVRAAADEKAAVLFEAERDVLLELLEVLPGAWAKVRHRDGQSGYVKVMQIWGA